MGARDGEVGSRDAAVSAQYEAYPYPARDPAEEARRLITGSPSHLPEVAHHLFHGRMPDPCRILVAGGGTGDALTMLAQQTADAGIAAEIVYLDLSEAARDIAEARIRTRGLTARVSFRTGSLLDAAALGRFDYIDCCGVIHHLDDPVAGLRALADALKPDGGMGLMVYGEFGRTGVYEMQEALRLLAPADTLSPGKQVARARAILETLPTTNRFRANPLMHDHLDSDAGLYDLLLHSRDRAYRAGAFLADIDAAGLRLASWIDPLRYRPETYLKDTQALRVAAKLKPAARADLAEALAGNMRKHICYVVPGSRADMPAARLSRRAIPVFRDEATARLFHAMPDGADALPLELDGLRLTLPLPRETKPTLALIDGIRTVEDIRKTLPKSPSWSAFERVFGQIFETLNGVSKLFLRG